MMYACEGIGLAAPQAGVLRRVIIADTRGEFSPSTTDSMNNACGALAQTYAARC